MSKKPLLVANWKMYVHELAAAKAWVAKVGRAKKSAEVWVAAPAPFVAALAKSSIKIGGQTLSQHEDGAHTGEVSAEMLKSAGAHFCIVGHSERRAAGEFDESIRAQVLQAAHAGLVPLLCVGESQRSPEGTHFNTIEAQLTSALQKNKGLGKLVVAYEPVWAIGKSAQDAMKPQELEETAIFVRKVLADILGREAALKAAILYGGSVEGGNAQVLLEQGSVQGFLVGHASAAPESFLEIVKACQ